MSYHILSKALCQAELMTFLYEVPNSKRIPLGIAAREALVSHIKKGIVLFLFENVADLPPLVFCWINARRVVGTGM